VSEWFTAIRDRLGGLWPWASSVDVSSYLPLLRPVAPFDGSAVVSPLTMLGAVIALASASGVALAALGVLLLALLVIHLVLTEVLGITIEFRPPTF
jgi:hypothetical protein